MADQFADDYKEARAAYDANRNQEAALLYARAQELAQRQGEKAQAFNAGFWEADAWRLVGKDRRAYSLLFKLLADAPEDAPVYERWLAETMAYQIWCTLGRRSRAERVARLQGLGDYGSSHPNVPPGDMPELWAVLAEDLADWDQALRSYEQAWTVHDEQNIGFRKCSKAYGAVNALLRLGRDAEATRWLELLGQTDQKKADGRRYFHLGQALLALFRIGPRSDWEAAHRALEDDLAGTQSSSNAHARCFLARLCLLLRPEEDPENLYHPARDWLRRKPEIKRGWNRLSVLADYRLAAVRYAAGMSACDDYYYQKPQTLPAHIQPADPADFARRVQRARLALTHLQKEADTLDRLNECVWYDEQARARLSRLAEIEAAAGR